MNPVTEIASISAEPWTQGKVEALRLKLIELAHGLNQLVSVTTSTASRVISGELGNSPKLPQGMTAYTFAGASVAEEVPHGLGRVPTGYLVIRRYPLGQVADANLASWNSRTVWLQTDKAGLSVTLLFF